QPSSLRSGSSRKQPDNERPANIDQQRAPGKRLPHRIGDPTRKSPARQATQPPANKYPKRVPHRCLVILILLLIVILIPRRALEQDHPKPGFTEIKRNRSPGLFLFCSFT